MTTPPHTLSEQTRVKLPITAWLLLIATAFGAGGGFAVAQYQIGEHTRRLEKLESDRELLLRIDERTVEIKRQIDRIAR